MKRLLCVSFLSLVLSVAAIQPVQVGTCQKEHDRCTIVHGVLGGKTPARVIHGTCQKQADGQLACQPTIY